MKITKLILHRYKRLFLGEIETLTLTPENKLSLILGKNGIGKSSLLVQLTPLPANLTKDYKEGGYKVITLEQDNDEYILTSGVNGGKKHSFLKNGHEFNPGGTLRVQTELVKEYFKITPHINNVILGLNTFTNMSPNERKKWITEISNVDYTYAVSVYNKLKQRHRDITGGIKLLTTNIAKVKLDVLEDEEVTKINNDIEMLSKFIEHLLVLIVHTDDSIPNISDMLHNVQVNSNNISRILSEHANIKTVNIHDIKTKLSVNNDRINNIVKQIDSINKEIIDIENAKLYTDHSDDVYKLKEELTKTITTISNNPIQADIKDMIGVPDAYMSIATDVTSILTQLRDCDDIDSSVDNYNKYTGKQATINDIVNRLNNNISRVKSELANMDKLLADDNKIKCSECGNEWHNHYDASAVDSLKIELKSYEDKLFKYKEADTKVTKIINDINKKRDIINNFKTLVYNNKRLSPVWDYIISGVDIHKTTIDMSNRVDSIVVSLNVWNNVLNAYSKLEQVNKKITELEMYKDIANKVNIDNASKLTDSLNKLTEERSRLLTEQNRLNDLLAVRTKYDRLVVDTKSGISKWYKTKDTAYVKLRNQHLRELITKLKELHIEFTNKLNNNNTVKARVLKDTQLLSEYQEKEKVIAIMLKELSPSEGLIAKSINSFLNVFLEDINTLINTIWTYDMRILPCEVSQEDDLDYKFKVLVDNRDIIDDISKTSSSMREIIDLVFRIMFMKYIGLHNSPLMLDEFGRTFDTEHRITAYNTVDKILMSNFTQVFMVSHFESMYGRFVNADVCVLNSDGVDLNNVESFNNTLELIGG